MIKEYKTKNKEVIMEFIEQNKSVRFCANDVIQYLKEQKMTINQATIYRNLEKMTQQGILMKTKNATDESCYFQYVIPNHHCEKHLHMQCKKCGKIIHLEDPVMEQFYKYIQEDLGFCLEHKESVLMGLCAACR